MIEIVDIPLYKCSVVFLIESTVEEWKEFFDKQYKEGRLQSSNDSGVREELETKPQVLYLRQGLMTIYAILVMQIMQVL